MKKFAGSIVAVVGALFFVPGIVALFQTSESLSAATLLLALFYMAAIVLGFIGAWVALSKPLSASKILAAATLSGIPVILLTLYLSTSLEGLYFRYTTMGLFFMAIATALVSKQKTE